MREITPEIFAEIATRLNEENVDEWNTKPVTFYLDDNEIIIQTVDATDAERVLYAMIAVLGGGGTNETSRTITH